eukprot:tig00021366_g20853.t1
MSAAFSPPCASGVQRLVAHDADIELASSWLGAWRPRPRRLQSTGTGVVSRVLRLPATTCRAPSPPRGRGGARARTAGHGLGTSRSAAGPPGLAGPARQRTFRPAPSSMGRDAAGSAGQPGASSAAANAAGAAAERAHQPPLQLAARARPSVQHDQQQRMPSPPPLAPATFEEARVGFDPVHLNKSIMRASRRSDWGGIVDLVTGFRFQLDPINIATSFSVLGKAVGRGDCPLNSLEARGGFLAIVWHRLLYVHDEMSARCICSIAYGLARMGLRDEKFLSMVSRMARARIGEFAAVDLANTAWSFATLRQPDPPLFDAIAAEAPSFSPFLQPFSSARRPAFIPAALRPSHSSPTPLSHPALPSLCAARPRGRRAQHISILLWSFAKLDQDAPEMFDAAAAVVRRAPEAYSAWSLANLMWSYAKLAKRDEALFEALGGAALDSVSDFSSQGIGSSLIESMANVLWSAATLKLAAPPALVPAFAAQAAARLDEFDPHSSFASQSRGSLSILAWSLASLGALSPDLCSRVAAAAAPAAPALIPQQARPPPPCS